MQFIDNYNEPCSIAGPAILSTGTEMNVLSIQGHMTLSRIQTPSKGHLMFTSTAMRSYQTLFDGLAVGKSKFEGNFLLGDPNGFTLVFDIVINVIGNERRSHDEIWLLLFLLEGG